MGVLDRFLDAIKLNDDYDDEYMDDEYLDDDDEDFLDDEDEKPRKKFFDKFSRKKSEDDLDDLDDDFEEEKPKPAPKVSAKSAPKASSSVSKAPSGQPEKASRPAQTSSKITPMRSSRRSGTAQAANIEVCVIKPTSMEDTREIADTLLDNSTVILNLEGIDVELAQRIIDFASGACYSLNGTLQKIASYIFVLGPSNVDITGDLQNILGGAAPSVRAGY